MPVPRRRRKGKDAAEPSDAEVAKEETAGDEASGEDKAEDAKPKRRSTRRTKASKEAGASASGDDVPEAKAEDDAPKAETDDAAADEAAPDVVGESAEPEEEGTEDGVEAGEPDEPDEAGARGEADKAEAAAEADDDSPEADGSAEAEEKPARRRRGAAETTTSRKEPVRPAPTRESDGAVQVRAQAKYVRSAPRKARLVMNHIRGRDVEQARAMLNHAPRSVSGDILKLLNSAVANAESNYELGADELRVAKAFVDEGPTIKRYRPRALGRATRILKRTSHMTIELTNGTR